MAVEVLLMRHGETEANVRQVLLGREDSPFTPAGSKHPSEVARHLEPFSISCVYASPMARAQRTATLVLEALGRSLPVRIEKAIAEIDAGDYTGLSFQEVRDRVPASERFGEFRYPGGESWSDVQSRAVEFVSCLEAAHRGDAVLLVTHAGVIAGLVAHVIDEAIERFIHTRFGHDYLGRLLVQDGSIVDYARLAGTVDSWF